MRLQVFVQNNSKQISFDTRQSARREMILRNATIFWRFKNINKNYNDIIADAPGTRLDIISERYHSFQDLQEIFKVTITLHWHQTSMITLVQLLHSKLSS